MNDNQKHTKRLLIFLSSMLIVAIAIVLGIRFLPSDKKSQPSTQIEHNPSLKAGDIVVLRVPGNYDLVCLPVDETANEHFLKALNARDTDGVAGLVTAGRAFWVKAGTHARVLDYPVPGGYAVRITDGDKRGSAGIVPDAWASKEVNHETK